PTGTGHDESACVAGLPASYFIRQMADWKSGDRKFSATMVTMAKVITDAEIKDAADYFASLKPRPWIRVVEADAVPKSYIGPGNKRLVHPDSGTEPLGNRIIEVPEDEEEVVYRDPMSGSLANVPKGSSAKGKELASTGNGKPVPCTICHGRTLQGLGDVPAIAGRHPNYTDRRGFSRAAADAEGAAAALARAHVQQADRRIRAQRLHHSDLRHRLSPQFPESAARGVVR